MVEQVRIILELVESQQIDGLAIIEAGTMTPVIKKAAMFESDAPKSLRSTYIGTNNTLMGQQLAKVSSSSEYQSLMEPPMHWLMIDSHYSRTRNWLQGCLERGRMDGNRHLSLFHRRQRYLGHDAN